MNAPAHTSTVTVGPWPGVQPRLLRTGPGIEDLTGYRSAGGYRVLADPTAFLDEIELAGLVGRGGAAFPLAVKLRTVRHAGPHGPGGRDTVVVANGEEGEPASIKDRWLLRNRPHLVLDGLRLVSQLVGAQHAHVYVSDAQSGASVRSALADTTPELLDGLTISVRTVPPGYVAGEESAAVRAINGGPAKPTDKPPRVFHEGVGGLPTLVSNVETLANMPVIHALGATEYRSHGTTNSSGTFLATVTAAGRPAGLYELPFGTPVAELIAHHGISPGQVRGILMGGYFAGLLNRDALNTTLDHESLRALGSGLGCGAVSVLTTECPVAVAASVLEYFDRENAGQCGSCFNGTAAMAAAAGALRDGTATEEDLTRLKRWSVVLRGRGACATLDAATNIAASLLAQFPAEVTRHRSADGCPDCGLSAYRATRPFEVEAGQH